MSGYRGLERTEVWIGGFGQNITDMDNTPLKNGARRNASMVEPHRPLTLESFETLRSDIVMRREVHERAIKAENHGKGRRAQFEGRAGYGVKQGCTVVGRAADDAEHLAGRGLVLEGLLYILKQARVPLAITA